MSSRQAGFTLIEIMIVVVLIGMLATIAIPSYVRARAESQAEACVNNLRQISGAKDRWAIENGKTDGATVLDTDILPYFIEKWPACPAGGTYTMNPVGTSPACSMGGKHVFN